LGSVISRINASVNPWKRQTGVSRAKRLETGRGEGGRGQGGGEARGAKEERGVLS